LPTLFEQQKLYFVMIKIKREMTIWEKSYFLMKQH